MLEIGAKQTKTSFSSSLYSTWRNQTTKKYVNNKDDKCHGAKTQSGVRGILTFSRKPFFFFFFWLHPWHGEVPRLGAV